MLAVIETHPVQYHAPVYRAVQQTHGIPVTVVYGSDFSVAGYRDREFQTTFSWDTDLLSGYTPVFLSRVESGGADAAERVSSRGLGDVIRHLSPAAVLTVGYSPRFHRDAWVAGWRAGCPLLFRGETNDEAKGRPWWKQVGRDAALRAAYRHCSRLLYVGTRSRRHFERLGIPAERLVFSPYCVSTESFEPDEAARAALRPATRRTLGIADDERLVLYSGKLSWRKGVDVLVEAAAALKAGGRSRVALAFVGDGPLRRDLESRAAAAGVHAIFPGFQNQQQLSPYYHAADLLVLPSRHSETWGLVVNEALHHGIACVVSERVGCAPDLVEPRCTGLSCEADSAPALAAAIDEALGFAIGESTRQACRARVARYTVAEAAAGIARAYSSVARSGQAA